MKAICDITLEYDDTSIAKKIQKSIEVDNLDFVRSQVKGKKLEAHIESTSISSLLHTLDDFLACVTVADKVLDKS